mgnify:CR=1 FL=1
MAIGDIIVGIDIGTTKVCTVVGEVNNFGQIETISSTSYKCSGLKKGKIINEDEISLSIAKTIKDAEDETNLKINSAYVTIPGKYVTIVQNSIVKDVKDKYSGISMKDVQGAISQIKDIEVPESQALVDIVLDKIVLENGTVVTDPVGSISSSFTMNAQIILAQREYVRKLTSIFKKAGLEIDGIVPTTLAERNLVLDTNELHDNIMLLDIGAGNIDIGVFEGQTFIYTNSIPVGGDNITNDIALVLNISEEEADKLKRQYGLALKSFIDNDNDIILNTCKDTTKNKIIKNGDIVSIDTVALKNGFNGDAARTFIVGDVPKETRRLVDVTKQAFFEGIKYAKPGNRIGDICHAIGEYVHSQGYSVVREFQGHGIGRQMHEDPGIPNYGKAGRGIRLEPGMTLAIEPMVIQGKPNILELDDGWTIITEDGSLAAHYENTILITKKEPEILTLL